MKRLTIKSKIMLWYTSLLAVLLGMLLPFIYFSMKSTMYGNAESLLKIHTAQALTAFEYEEEEDKRISLEGFKNIADTSFIIYGIDNIELLRTEYNADFGALSADFDNVRMHDGPDGLWLVYDQKLEEDDDRDDFIGWIRAYSSLEPMEAALKNLRLIIIALVPVYLLIATIGGWLLSKEALSPIDGITRTAKEISSGDLSKRLNMAAAHDEVGRLAETFDDMIEKLDKAFKQEKQFTSNASHELRTPISVIISSAEAALDDGSGERYREALRQILSVGRRMSGMVSKLLVLSRGDEARYNYEFEKIDIGLLVSGVVEDMQEKADKKNIKVEYDCNQSIMIRADQTLIIRIFINLIDNSIKYSGEGSSIRVSLKSAGGFCEAVVEDFGQGIPEEDLPHVFNRFYRADKSRSGEGAGLGLSIVKWAVEIHKGEVKITSQPGKGTRVIVRLPF